MTQFFQRTAVSRPRLAQCGFSLLEMAIAMVVAGLMSWAAFSGYETLSEQQEIERLKREVTKLKAERDILKKAAAYFAREAI